MRWRVGSALLGGLFVAACASSEHAAAPSSASVVASSESTNSVAIASTETVTPATPVAEPPVALSVPAPDISADLEQPLCRDLATSVDGLVEAPLVPVGARTVGDPNGACEILYAIPPASAEVIIGRIPKPTSGHNGYLTSQRTEDGDETSVHWDTGSIAYIDPTGRDLLNLSSDAQVIVQRLDGSRLYVATYGQDDDSLAVGIAREFDNRLGANAEMSSVTVVTVLASDAPRVVLAEHFIAAFNRGDRLAVLALMVDDPSVSDCDYATAMVVDLQGGHEVSAWLRGRIADHDRFLIERIENENTDASSAALGVTFARRTSDSLRALGFADGVQPQSAAKIRFTGSGTDLRIEAFANGPGGGPSTLCEPV